MDRICFISLSAYGYFNDDAPPGGGAQRQLHLLGTHLTDSFDVHFVVGDYGQSTTERREGVTLHKAYLPRPDRSAFAKPIELAKLLAAMRRVDPDVVVYRGNPWKASIIYLLTRLVGGRWVYHLANDSNVDEEPDELSLPVRWLFEHALSTADGIIAQTDYQAKRLRNRFGAEAKVIPNGYFSPDGVKPHDERKHLIWVGRLNERQKRPHLFLDLAERLPQCSFLLIGPDGLDPEYSTRIRNRASDLENVRALGRVDPDQVHEYYRDAMALVNTSAFEGFPNTFLEAWRYDTPVISLKINPNRFVAPPVEGYADGDFDQFVTMAERVGADVAYRRKLSQSAGDYVRSELSIEKVAREYASVLSKSLGG